MFKFYLVWETKEPYPDPAITSDFIETTLLSCEL